MEVTTSAEALRRQGPPWAVQRPRGPQRCERCAGLETSDAEADPPGTRGRLPAVGKRATRAPTGSAGVMAAARVDEGDGRNTGSPAGGVDSPRGSGRAEQGGGEARTTEEAG